MTMLGQICDSEISLTKSFFGTFHPVKRSIPRVFEAKSKIYLI